MKMVNLRRFSEPDTLREISPRTLVALMDGHRGFLAGKGVELPPLENAERGVRSAESGTHLTPDPSPQGGEGKPLELDYEQLARVFLSPEGIPPELVDRFHLVKQMSGPRQMDRILETVRERQLELPLPVEQCSPEDIAAHLLLTDRPLFQELHAELAVTLYRAFAYFTPRRKRADFKPPASLAGLEKTLNGWYEAHRRARSARVFWRQHGVEYWFHVRHAEPLKREGLVDVKDCESGSAIYHPERHGLVIYNAQTGELRMHADSEREVDLFRLAFGLHLFDDGNFFPAGSHKFTLNPLKLGRKALAWGGIEGIRGITLRDIEYQVGGDRAARDKTSAPDVFAVFEARGFEIPAEAEIRMARFLVWFEGESKPVNFVIRPSNIATFSRDNDAVVLEPWLVRQKFALTQRDEDGPNGTWGLELVAEGHPAAGCR